MAKPPSTAQLADAELVAKLKAYRLETSRTENVQAYEVFNNRQMEDLISQARTIEELQQISGFGPVKAEKYGPAILAALRSGPTVEPQSKTKPDRPPNSSAKKSPIEVLAPGQSKASVAMR